MNIRQFRAELAEAFEAAGFERKKFSATKATIWLLPGREVDREFWEHAIRRPWGFLLSGSLSIDVPAFRTWLTHSFPLDEHGILWSGLFGRHIANYRDMFFAIEEGPPPFLAWVEAIKAKLAALPDTIDGLLQAEGDPSPNLELLKDGYEAPAAWRYFKVWAAGAEPNAPPPYRLPTGQLVDVAANDLQ